MNFHKLLKELDAAHEDCAETFAADIVNAVSEWAAENGHPSLVRDRTPAAQPIEVKRYLAECIAVTATKSDGPLTPLEVAEQVGVTTETVIEWIRSGQLKGSNIGKGQQRGRYRILPSDLNSFLASRQPDPPTPAPRTSRKASSVKNYRA